MIHQVRAGDALIPAIGFGTWELRDETCAQLVCGAIGLGYRHIDTAGMYQNEEAVGAGIVASGVPREELFVTTKVWLDHLGHGTFQEAAENSLLRLGLDDVDLLLIHWPRSDLNIHQMIEPLLDVKARGLARHIGVSNFPSALLEKASTVANGSLATNQCEYHPYLNQDVVLNVCRTHSMAFTSYCPIGRGMCFDDPVLKEIANNHAKTPAQIVLRWHIQQEGVVAIPRSGNMQRIAENIMIGDFALSEDEMAAIMALRTKNQRICDYGFSPVWDAV